MWHARETVVRLLRGHSRMTYQLSDCLFFRDARFLTCSESLRISASNARMHSRLVPCGPSAIISPHERHTSITCDCGTIGLFTVSITTAIGLPVRNYATFSEGMSTNGD